VTQAPSLFGKPLTLTAMDWCLSQPEKIEVEPLLISNNHQVAVSMYERPKTSAPGHAVEIHDCQPREDQGFLLKAFIVLA